MRVFVLVFSVCMICLAGSKITRAEEENPLFLSEEATSDLGEFEPVDTEEVWKEAKELQRKADLLRKAAKAKYEEATKLITQAGGLRAQASAKTQAIMARAQTNELMAGLFSSLFSSFSGMAASQGQMPPLMTNVMEGLGSGIQRQAQAEMSYAEGMKGKYETEAEDKASPLETKAGTLEEEGNKLQAAANKFQALANVKTLLYNAEELRLTISEESEEIQALKTRVRSTIEKVSLP